MKFFKYSVLALAFAAAFSACDDETYTPGAPSEGVYILTDNPTAVELDRNENSFEVKVARSGESSAATYALIGSASDEEAFTLPASVSFAEGETETTVSIAYNQAVMAMDKAYKVMIAFPSEVTVSDYGYRSLEMAVTLPAPWVTIGKGTYQDMLVIPCYFDLEGESLAYECELQRHEIDKTRYRWLHPYSDNFAKACAEAGLELEANEYDSKNQYNIEFIVEDGYAAIPYQATGVTINEKDGMLYIATQGGIFYSAGNPMSAIIAARPETLNIVTFDKHDVKHEDGTVEKDVEFVATIFQQPDNLRLEFVPNPTEGYYAANADYGGYNWWEEGVDIKDYNVTISYQGVLNTPDENSFVLADITLGEDIKSAKAGLVKTADIAEGIEAVAADKVKTQELSDGTEFKGLRFEYEGSADYVLAVVAYNEEGEEAATQGITFFVADVAAPKEWKKLGQGIMVDAWMAPAFASKDGVRVDPMKAAYNVDIEENIENAGIYRIIAPWTCADYPFSHLNDNSTSKPNIVVDARDPQFVTMAPQYSGFDMQGYNMWVSSIADDFIANGNTKEQIIGAGFNNVMEEGEICITYPTWSNLKSTTEAPAYCGKSWYDEDEPYSPELEACPGIFALPEAVQSTVAKVQLNKAAARLQLRGKKGHTISFNKFNMPTGKFVVRQHSSKRVNQNTL